MIKTRKAEKLKIPRGISELKRKIIVRGMCKKWGIQKWIGIDAFGVRCSSGSLLYAFGRVQLKCDGTR